MAHFKYLGESFRPGVTPGPCTQVKVPKKDGTTYTYTPVPPATTFVVGADIGYDITDQRSLRVMRADTRFEEMT